MWIVLCKTTHLYKRKMHIFVNQNMQITDNFAKISLF